MPTITNPAQLKKVLLDIGENLINQVSKEIQEINYDREFNHRDSNNPWG